MINHPLRESNSQQARRYSVSTLDSDMAMQLKCTAALYYARTRNYLIDNEDNKLFCVLNSYANTNI